MPQTIADRQARRRQAATSMAATALVADVARRLGRHRIQVMPVKGALLQHWLYDDPSERAMTDVDLLLRGETISTATRVLEAAGYRRTPHRSIGGVVMLTPFGLPLDLHPELFDRARYRLPGAELFERSTQDLNLFGEAVQLPTPLDAYAHLVGKFGSDQLNARFRDRLVEIAKMGRRLDASPKETAGHLTRVGMRRVACYVLQLVHEASHDPFALAVRRQLAPDPVGRALVALARPVLDSVSPPSRAGAIMAHLLNESVPRGIRSGLRGARARRRP